MGNRLYDILQAARGYHFEDGMTSLFSDNLVAYLKGTGNQAIEDLETLIVLELVDNEVLSEALRWVGYVEDGRTYAQRLRLLGRCLSHPSPRVRDGALLGIASMDDPSAYLSLLLAAATEPIMELRKNMTQVLKQLQDTWVQQMEGE